MNLGFSEIIIILVLALILLGPKRLPDVAKQLGKGMREFKKATDDLKSQFEREFYAEDLKKNHPNVIAPPTAAAPVQAPPPAPAPPASVDNIPGLDAALVEASPAPAAQAPAPRPPETPPSA